MNQLIAGTNIVDPASLPKYNLAAQPAAATPDAGRKLTNYVRPSARDRWQASVLSYYTPQIIENTFRGALSGNLVAQWMLMDLMEQTWPRLNKNLNEIKDGAKALNRIVKPYADKDEKPTDEAVRRAKIVDKLLRTMRPNRKKLERDLDDTIYDVLDALGKGLELSEILWEEERRPVNIAGTTTNLWCPRATRWVHPRYYGYPSGTAAEEELMLNSREIAQTNPEFQGSSSLWLPIPDDQFILSIIQQKSGHPINGSLLRILGFLWAASNFTWEWFLNFAQIFGAPIRWATYDPATSTAGTVQLIMDMLAQMGSFGYAAFPAGTQLELKEAVKSAQDNPQKALLDAADLICDLMIIGQTLTSQSSRGGEGGGGNRALGQVHQDIRLERIQKAGNTAAKTISETFIRAICRLNFGDDSECPELIVVTKANKDLVAQAQRYQLLLQIPGVEVSKQQFYEDNELTQPDENDDVLEGQSVQSPMANGQGPGKENAALAMARGPGGCRHGVVAQGGGDATDKLVNHVLENLTGIEAKWLGGVKPIFRELIVKAKDSSATDADLIRTIERAQREMPDLFHKLDTAALAQAFERSSGAALVNGVVRGHLQRGNPKSEIRNPNAEVAK